MEMVLVTFDEDCFIFIVVCIRFDGFEGTNSCQFYLFELFPDPTSAHNESFFSHGNEYNMYRKIQRIESIFVIKTS